MNWAGPLSMICQQICEKFNLKKIFTLMFGTMMIIINACKILKIICITLKRLISIQLQCSVDTAKVEGLGQC